jgi:hypothetical protein
MIKLRNVPHEEPLQGNPLQWTGAGGDPPVTAGVRGHPGFGYLVRGDPGLYGARGDFLSTLSGLATLTGWKWLCINAVRSGDADRLEVVMHQRCQVWRR